MKIALTLIKILVISYLFLFSYLNYNSVEVVLFTNIGPLTNLEPISMPLFVVVFASFGAGLLLSIIYISINKVKARVNEYKLNKTIRTKDKEIFALKERFLATDKKQNNTGAMNNLSLGLKNKTSNNKITDNKTITQNNTNNIDLSINADVAPNVDSNKKSDKNVAKNTSKDADKDENKHSNKDANKHPNKDASKDADKKTKNKKDNQKTKKNMGHASKKGTQI